MQFPEIGFWQHYKHTAEREFNNYTYEVIGTAWHTEDRSHLVLYRPLYGDCAYLEGADYGARPLSMWNEMVEWEGKTVPRFVRITDPAVLEKLEAVKKEMYGV